MIQLRRIRSYTPAGQNPVSTESPAEPPFLADSIADLFKPETLQRAIDGLAPHERWNIFYTLGQTDGDHKRTWHGQDVIPFDIDGIVDEAGAFDEAKYLEVIFAVLEVDPKKCIIVASGNGLQILVQPPFPIVDKGFFRKQNTAYKRLCSDIAAALAAAGLPFKEVDPSSFAINRILRLPGTENRKADKPPRQARLINGTLEPQRFVLSPGVVPGEAKAKLDKEEISEKQMAFFAVDSPAVEAGCDFLRWASAAPEDVSEPQWYGLLSIVGRLANGRERAHEISRGHPKYSATSTDRKLDQALAASGPRTCDGIDKIWGKCQGCPNFKKIASPILLKSEAFVATEQRGFYLLTKKGLTPQYEDLRRCFNRDNPYRTHRKSGAIYVHDGKKYETWSKTEMRNYADEKFDPKCEEKHALEFLSRVNRSQLVGPEWFRESISGHINFRNGVLAIGSGELNPHSPDHGFLYVLPYDYDAAATCPTFDQFMLDFTCGDTQLETLLLEFIGYSICCQDYWLQKALLLIGKGANGKSTFLTICKELVGGENVSWLSLAELQIQEQRSHLEGKILNISDELPNYRVRNTEIFKKLFGGFMTTRKLYENGIMVENFAKFIFAGNEAPLAEDVSEGFLRRLVIVPCRARFATDVGQVDAKAPDHKIVDKIKAELAGVFNRVMAHYRTLEARGVLIESASALEAHASYREEIDRPGAFIDENLYWNGSWSDADPFVDADAVYERYVSECRRSEEKPLPKVHWTRALARKIDHFSERHVRISVNNERRRILRGVEFRTGAHKPTH